MEGKPADTYRASLLPSITGEGLVRWSQQPKTSMKWALLWGDPAGFQMKTIGERGRMMFSCLLSIKAGK